ncbi:DUF6318 family protein [Cellulomonas persica]|uniref:DUF6318 domain-containing protein n=1 Tax=Cellulomonas persica TaxID=76861 RepID=A0A510URG1_9CELL|nr:DUF6318 family protein [Cellulomonas persica]GEK17254.1 hypothetical protein CPE01_09870 [Cellulomonas persica]
MLRTRALLTIALAALTLAACTSPSPDPSASAATSHSVSVTQSPPSTSIPAPPTPSATPATDAQDATTPPARPEALDGPASEENAKAVGRYFMSLFPYAVATGDLEAWDALSGPSCKYCQSLRDAVAEIHDAGNRGTGGAFELGFTSGFALGNGEFIVGLEYFETPSQTVAPDGTVVADYPDRNSMKANISLSWTGSSWVVNGVDVETWGEPE